MTPDNRSRALHWAKLLFFLMLGNTMLAWGVCAFVVPNRFMLGGATGIALFLKNFVPLRLSVLSAILNAGFFLLGLVMIGREFAATALFSTAFFPLVLAVFEQVPWTALIVQDRTIAALFGSVVMGMGIGLVIRAGGSTGGMDIPPIILQKYRGIPVGNSMFAFDAAIIVAQMCFQGVAELVYSLTILFVVSFAVNRTVIWGGGKVQMIVISKRFREIADVLTAECDNGVTLLSAEGGWQGEKTCAVLTVMYAKKYPRARAAALRVDPEAFIITSQVTGVNGLGYTLDRQRRAPRRALQNPESSGITVAQSSINGGK